MKERPILFSAPMVRALLAGAKTQTRRVLKRAKGPSLSVDMIEDEPGVAELSWLCGDGPGYEVHETVKRVACPYGVPGDQLWVRETFSPYEHRDGCWYWADGDVADYDCSKPKPSIHMPRWASRVTLEVTDIRVERLQDISADDAKAEGISEFIGGWWCEHDDAEQIAGMTPQEGYRHLWERINGPGSWDANPWVWVVSFTRVKP